jgi:flagellar hook-associated protein 2
MGTSSLAPTFSGISSYAGDLQSVLTRAVRIASMPMTQMQNQLQTITSQSSALSSLNTVFSSLQTAIGKLDSALGSDSYAAQSSDSSQVSVSATSGALAASYSIEVSNIGSYSAAVSADTLPAVSEPALQSISSSTAYTLTVNGKSFAISTGGASLTALALAINCASAGVQASLVNTGSSASPQYRLVLRSDDLGPDAIQLNDGSQDLLDSLGSGEYAEYKVNGLGGSIQSSSRQFTLSPGVTATLVGTTVSGHPVTLAVSRNTDSVSSAISAFVTAYNAAVDALGQQFGENAGQLSGQSIVRDLSHSLRSVLQFTGSSGAVTSMAQMGLSLDNLGHLAFDDTKLSSAGIDAVQSFLGSASTGGFLKNAADALKRVEDSTSGSLTVAMKQAKDAIATQNQEISDEQKRVDDLQANLQEQLAAADALIASLESQKTYLSNLFTAMMNANSGGVKSA